MEKVNCDCGESIVKSYLLQHQQTDVHRRRLNKLRKCTVCKIEKGYNEFYKKPYKSDGLIMNVKNA